MESFIDLISKIRILQGITQTKLSQKIGISQSAITQFEKSKATLSIETLKRIAKELGLNPEYFENRTPNPFIRDFYFFKIGSLLKAADIKPVLWFLEHRNIIDVFLLLPPIEAVGRIIRGGIADEMVYAIVLRDRFGNVFLFREVLFTVFIFNSKTEGVNALRPAIDKVEGRDNSRDIKLHFIKIPIDVYEKIRDWTITKADLEFMLKQSVGSLKENEEKLILYLRENNINPETLITSSAPKDFLK